MRSHSQAFSLVELSIVLVILGLLVGGVLAGKSLIRASEMRAVGTEYQRYLTATQAFRDKYFAIPGDFMDATRFWGRMNSNADCVTNSAAAVAASGGACDGNNNRTISNSGAASQAGEFAQFWLHLANAGLIEGTFSGLAGAGGSPHCVIGTDCPRSKLGNGGWGISYTVPNYAGDVYAYALDYGNFFRFGAQSTTNIPGNALLTPEEAWNIDTKNDDGKPATGKIIARFWDNACAVPDDGATFTNTNYAASYKLTDNTAQCAFFFRKVAY